MPKGSYKIFLEVVSFKVEPDQKEWLENKTLEQTSKHGVEVTQTMILRSLIRQQMDLDKEKRKVWDDDEVQVPCSV